MNEQKKPSTPDVPASDASAVESGGTTGDVGTVGATSADANAEPVLAPSAGAGAPSEAGESRAGSNSDGSTRSEPATLSGLPSASGLSLASADNRCGCGICASERRAAYEMAEWMHTRIAQEAAGTGLSG